ncbi:MAG: imidazole glycerol phosphate synthase subunit HisF [Myxococcota bacterium]
MIAPRVIPCLDVRDGRVVKGVKFQGLRDAGDPRELAARYEEQGADELVLLDVSATQEGRRAHIDTIRAVRAELSIPLTVGGGVRSLDDAQTLLEAGADKVSVNTAAVREPQLLSRMAAEFGRQCTVLAIDAIRRDTDGWSVVVRSGSEDVGWDALEWAGRGTSLGAGEILLTSWDRDGTHEGYDLELLRLTSQRVRVPVIASGGAAGPIHMAEGLEAGADAVLAASIFHFSTFTVESLKGELAEHGIEVRR